MLNCIFVLLKSVVQDLFTLPSFVSFFCPDNLKIIFWMEGVCFLWFLPIVLHFVVWISVVWPFCILINVFYCDCNVTFCKEVIGYHLCCKFVGLSTEVLLVYASVEPLLRSIKNKNLKEQSIYGMSEQQEDLSNSSVQRHNSMWKHFK